MSGVLQIHGWLGSKKNSDEVNAGKNRVCSPSDGACESKYYACFPIQQKCQQLVRNFSNKKSCEEYLATTYPETTTGLCYSYDAGEDALCQGACQKCTDKCFYSANSKATCASEDFYCPPSLKFYIVGQDWNPNNESKLLDIYTQVFDWNAKKGKWDGINANMSCIRDDLYAPSKTVAYTAQADYGSPVGPRFIFNKTFVGAGFKANSSYICTATLCERRGKNIDDPDYAIGKCYNQEYKFSVPPSPKLAVSTGPAANITSNGFTAQAIITNAGLNKEGLVGIRVYMPVRNDYKDFYYPDPRQAKKIQFKTGDKFSVAISGYKPGTYKYAAFAQTEDLDEYGTGLAVTIK